jgi:transcriptional regulator of acetoin/glycerol metabolism
MAGLDPAIHVLRATLFFGNSMSVPQKPIASDLLACARRLYEETRTPINEICTLLGLPSSTFYRRVEKWGWAKRLFVMPSIRCKDRR